ncbi:hypothetical protein [Ensifer aridi]|uniref:hypothetical protein n=1 Tax=Ensifer aridi TaxID=1708715 RepID=UPI000A0FA5BF|nr:hypothetical protein [Ensifer aridi]
MFWEIVKGLGAIVGLVTGCFVIWERFYRFTPSAFIVASSISPGSPFKEPHLRVINRSERPIILKWRNETRANRLGLGKDLSLRVIIASLLDGESAIAIDGNSDYLLPLFRPQNYKALPDEAELDVDIWWSFAQPLIWKRERKITLRITKRNLKYVVGGSDTDEVLD